MRFKDLKSDANFYEDALVHATLFKVGKNPFPWVNLFERPIDADFIENWLKAEVTLNSWITYPNFDFEKVQREAKLSVTAKKEIKSRRASMYNWMIEYKCQNVIAGRFKHIASTFPNYLPQFAKNEFTKINEFLSSKLTPKKDLKAFADYFGLNPNIDLKKLLKKNQSKNFDNPFNIHSPDLQFEYDYLMRYYKYLEEYLKDNCVFEQENNIFREEEISTIKNIYKDLIDLCNSLIVKYDVEEYEDRYSVSIITVAGCRTPDDLKVKMLDLAEKGFINLTSIAQNVPSAEINRYFVGIATKITGLKKLIGKGETRDEFDNSNPISTFTNAKFIGPRDYKFAFFEDLSYLQSLLWNYIATWTDTIDEIVRKVENLRNHLQLSSLPTSKKELNRQLNLQRCSLIAEFTLSNKKFISYNDSKDATNEDLLYFLFDDYKNMKINHPSFKCRLHTEWKTFDVYFLLYQLEEVFGISIGDVDAKQIFYLKKDRIFSRHSYDTFKSQKLKIYKINSKNKAELIELQISSLLEK